MKNSILLLLLLASLFSAERLSAQQADCLPVRPTAFVKGGLTAGFFDGDASNENSRGRTGYQLATGLFLPLQSSRLDICLVPSLELITKGESWDLGEQGRATVEMRYLEMPIDVAFYATIKKWRLIAGGGGFVSYGVGGRLTGSDQLYIYHGYRLKEKPAVFGPVIGAPRWDAGIHLLLAAQMKHLLMTSEIDIGLANAVPSRFGYSRTAAISLGLGYAF